MSSGPLSEDMSSSSVLSSQHSVSQPRSNASVDTNPDCCTETLLALLGDKYTRAALEAVAEMPRSGREVSACTSMSRPTAFRRLNELETAGLVTTEQHIDESGHHHKRYRSVVEEISFELTADGLAARITTAGVGSQQPTVDGASDE